MTLWDFEKSSQKTNSFLHKKSDAEVYFYQELEVLKSLFAIACRGLEKSATDKHPESKRCESTNLSGKSNESNVVGSPRKSQSRVNPTVLT